MIFFFVFSLVDGHISMIVHSIFLFSEFIHSAWTPLAFVAYKSTIAYHITRVLYVMLRCMPDVTLLGGISNEKPRIATEGETGLTIRCKAVFI